MREPKTSLMEVVFRNVVFWEENNTLTKRHCLPIEGIYHEGISHSDKVMISLLKCPECGCELSILKRSVMERIRECLRKAVKKGES
jgi:hypothetical protein